ncbi:adenylyltransferase/cytidyltransferase family protein [Candidatus Saccharibacteria bacterium]|nr:adenylyltransferase/cytidyltransferase family protein [Candidatus Saccharibacteria bacterium]
MTARKIGICSGTFDPIHEGHVAFIEAAIAHCNLDVVYIIPEQQPRGKQHVTAFEHRVAMARQVESARIQVRTVPAKNVGLQELEAMITKHDQLYLLIGTDVALSLKTWPDFDRIRQLMQFVIGIRSDADATRIHTLMAHLEIAPSRYSCIKTDKWEQSSSRIRASRRHTNEDIEKYIQTHALYEV